MKSLFKKLAPTKSVPTRADPSVLAEYHLPYLAPITKYDDAKDALIAAESTEEAIAVILAYVEPKVEERGAAGDPVSACNYLDIDVPERRDEIQLVRRALGLHRKLATGWGAGAGTTGGGADGGAGF